MCNPEPLILLLVIALFALLPTAVPGVLKGRKVAGLGACEPEVTAVGGIYIDVGPTEAHVDGNMVSAKGWTGLAAFMRECLKVLGTKITHS